MDSYSVRRIFKLIQPEQTVCVCLFLSFLQEVCVCVCVWCEETVQPQGGPLFICFKSCYTWYKQKWIDSGSILYLRGMGRILLMLTKKEVRWRIAEMFLVTVNNRTFGGFWQLTDSSGIYRCQHFLFERPFYAVQCHTLDYCLATWGRYFPLALVLAEGNRSYTDVLVTLNELVTSISCMLDAVCFI